MHENRFCIDFWLFIHAFFVLSAHDYPDIEIVVGAGGLSGDTSGAMRRMVGITDEFYYTVFRDIIGTVSLCANHQVNCDFALLKVAYLLHFC